MTIHMPASRRELVRGFVLNALCDDFENIDQVILPDVAREGAKCGLTIDRFEVVDTLRSLVTDGLVKAYDLSAAAADPFSTELPGMPPVDEIEDNFKTYFYITQAGMDIHMADAP